MPLTLLDTDILSEVLTQKNATVSARAAVYLQQFGAFSFSAFTRYEVTRGLKDKNAVQQLARFATFCQHSQILPVTDAILDRAAALWVLARQGGHPGRDADLIIAATALESGQVLATGNRPHFAWIPNLIIDDWRIGTAPATP